MPGKRRDRSGDEHERAAEQDSGPAAVRGWLLVLCLVLLAWQPINMGLAASSVLDALPVRGAPLAVVLLVRLVVTALGIAAGLALLGQRPAAPVLARASLVASAVTDTVVYSTTWFPSNRTSGETELLLAASLAFYAIWLTYLSRSKRVRRTFARA